MQNSLFLKVIVVGDSGVGKTSLLNQYCYGKFDYNIRPTVGCDFCLKAFNNYNGRSIRLQLWDVAGQERFHSLSKLYVRGAVGCIIVCDITSEDSLQATLKWRTTIEENADTIDGKQIPIILIQNKSDLLADIPPLELQTFQKPEKLEEFASTHKFFKSFQVSAKTGANIETAIQALLDEMLTLNLPLKDAFGTKVGRPSGTPTNNIGTPDRETHSTRDDKALTLRANSPHGGKDGEREKSSCC